MGGGRTIKGITAKMLGGLRLKGRPLQSREERKTTWRAGRGTHVSYLEVGSKEQEKPDRHVGAD